MSELVPYHWINGTHISFGIGAAKNLKKYIPHGSRVMFIHGGKSVYMNGSKKDLDNIMNEIGASARWRGGIEPNPDYHTCMNIIKELRKAPADFIIPVGGGSIMDAAKFISTSVYLPSQYDPWETLKNPSIIDKVIPSIAVCTLSATGSEWNERYVISRRSTGEKVPGASPKAYFKVSILDPRYTITVNRHQTENGLFDSFCHVMEQYITGHFAPLQDRMSEAVASTILENAPKLLSDLHNLNYRANAMQCSAWALNTSLQTGSSSCWGTHRAALQLTAKYGMDHGETLVCILPNLWRYFFDTKKFKLAQMSNRVFGKATGSVEEDAKYAIRKTEEYAQMLEFKLHVRDYAKERACEKDIIEMTEKTWSMMGRKPFGEAGMIKKEDLKRIYQNSF